MPKLSIPSATPAGIFAAEYHGQPNIMTPHRVTLDALYTSRHKLIGAVELASGEGIEHQPIYGVSVVLLRDDGTTLRAGPRLNQLFQSEDEARIHMASIRAMGRARAKGYIYAQAEANRR